MILTAGGIWDILTGVRKDSATNRARAFSCAVSVKEKDGMENHGIVKNVQRVSFLRFPYLLLP